MATLSQNGYNFIRTEEGVIYIARKLKYSTDGGRRQVVERWATTGIGHYGPDVIEGRRYSDAEIQNLFAKDKQRFEADVNKVWTSDMPKGAFDALFSLAYNHGNVSRTAVGKAAKAGMWKTDKQKFINLWLNSYTCKGLLTKRRKREVALFFSMDANSVPMPAPTQMSAPPTNQNYGSGNTSALSYSEATQNNTLSMDNSQSIAFNIDDGEKRTRIYKASDPTILVDELSIPMNEGSIRDENNSTS